MDYDTDKVDDAVLALLYLTMSGGQFGVRAWKGHDWEALKRLHDKGYIGDLTVKAPTVTVTEEGRARAEEMFRKLFGKPG
jgi:hypothetical protein